jgi:hypothetical protein
VREHEREAAMTRRVTDGPGDELRRQREDLRRRTNWENPADSRPDPNWERADRADPGRAGRDGVSPDRAKTAAAGDPLLELRDLLDSVIRLGRGRPRRR